MRRKALWHACMRWPWPGRDAALRRRLGDAARRDIIRRDMTWPGQACRVVALAEAAMAAHAAPSRHQSEFYAEPRG
jgi:hypothetical protein